MKLILKSLFFILCFSCGEKNENLSPSNEQNSEHIQPQKEVVNFLLDAGHAIDLIAIENDEGQVTNIIKITREANSPLSLKAKEDQDEKPFDTSHQATIEESEKSNVKNTIYFENYVIKVPEAFEPIYNEDGSPVVLGKKGSHGIVFQVNKILDDGRVEPWAMKYLYRHNEVLTKVSQWFQGQSEVEEEKTLVKQWKKFGNPIQIETFEGRDDIVMKTIVQGRTLKELIEQGTFFSDVTGKTKNHSENLQETLRQLILDISDSKQIFDDLNPANIMYDYTTRKWVVIDSKLAEFTKTEKEALNENTKKFVNKVIYSTTIDEHNMIHAQKKILGTGKNTPEYTLKTFVKMVEFAESISKLNEHHIMENLIMKKEDARLNSQRDNHESLKRELNQDQSHLKQTPPQRPKNKR